MFSVYILYSPTADRYYIGHTADLKLRMASHNHSCIGLNKYTRNNGPWNLVYQESNFTTRSEAMRREREIKQWKSRKKIETLVASTTSVRNRI
ncbi:MAG: GIY-YIG nuclease family protein [Chitinispirillaceae bacterium]|nr:GIY-YIG nuclease family protein [Chitinispirillaceae bacterium]